MTDRKPQDQDRYIVRFPEGVRERLKALAEENGRSLNAEIVTRLLRTIEEDDLQTLSSKDFGLHQGPLKEILDQLRELKELNLRVVETRHSPDAGEDEVTLAYGSKKRPPALKIPPEDDSKKGDE